jgi:hypothetical protein
MKVTPEFVRRRIPFFLIALLLASSGPEASAQSGSTRTGYVIVTPTFGDTSRLVVFETFRFRSGFASNQTSVVDARLTTNASVFVTSDFASGRNLGLSIVNPGTADASLNLTLYRSGGSVVSVKQISVPGQRQISLFASELFRELNSASSFNGLINLVSAAPVAVLALRFQNQDFSAVPLIPLLPFTSLVPPRLNGAGGPGAVMLPQIAVGGGWTTEIVLTNTSIGPVSVRVDVFSPSGGPLSVPFNIGAGSSFGGITIPPNGVVVLSTTGL